MFYTNILIILQDNFEIILKNRDLFFNFFFVLKIFFIELKENNKSKIKKMFCEQCILCNMINIKKAGN